MTTHQAAHVAVLEWMLTVYPLPDFAREHEAITSAIKLMKQSVKASIAGRPLYLFGREHFEDKQKPMAEIELGMEMDGYVVFHMKDPNQPVPAAPTEASR
jgi:hypothetical protein